MRYGAAKGRRGLVIVTTLGTGIGSALVYDGVLVPNSELGHLEIDGHDAEKRAASSAREREDLSWEEWAEAADDVLPQARGPLLPRALRGRRRRQQEGRRVPAAAGHRDRDHPGQAAQRRRASSAPRSTRPRPQRAEGVSASGSASAFSSPRRIVGGVLRSGRTGRPRAPSRPIRNLVKFHLISAAQHARLLVLEPLVERVGAVAVDVDLGEHREGHAVVALAERRRSRPRCRAPGARTGRTGSRAPRSPGRRRRRTAAAGPRTAG